MARMPVLAAGDIVLRIDKAIRAGEPILVLRNREPTANVDRK